ncbi:PhoX family protein [Lysobacter sp. S4-A87]|uniref:alkaline phosphatase PhoX n=1 Tax=Lysobacter sp. S4-A87 TaxID=2925843 RepID=UPI001F52E7EE|nr:alkaline phosphatase PhoX [Lysobacter sp. S4-A87]UNK49372.1 PhoX family protein [Lysobacter sp. S4-A87]
MNALDLSRRQVLKGGAAAMAVGAMGSLGALYSRQALAAGDPTRLAPIPGRYGPLAPVADRATGLPLLQLPRGFSYRSFGWSGDVMSDGQPCPDRHDGMAVVGLRRPGSGPRDNRHHHGGDHGRGHELVLIRNHERGAATPINAPGMYDSGDIGGGQVAGGGTTTMTWRHGEWRSIEASLGGTLVNCAGGPTPWGSWLSCEEIKTDAVSSTGKKHGYVFEVHAEAERTSGRPLIGLGRFSHEAVAIDPRTGVVYLTEDDRNKAGLYRFIPNDRAGRYGSLEHGGRLQAARVRRQPNADLTVAAIGDEYALEWVDIPDPDLDSIAAPSGFPDISAGETLSGPFAQAWSAGALRMSRGEGIWHSYGKMFIVDTSTGVDAQGRKGRGNGAVWVLDLLTQRMRALFVSGNQLAAHNPDNITVSGRGGVLLCEDGGESPDQYGPGARLIGLTRQGESFYFCKNNIELTSTQISNAGKVIPEGDYRDSEFCGACWDPFSQTLFVNIQTPGITVAITGPWERGHL